MHQQTGARLADLTAVEEGRKERTADGAIKVGILEDDVGRLAAKLQRDRLEPIGRNPHHRLAHFRRAREGNLVDVGVAHQRSAEFVGGAGNHVEHAGRDTAGKGNLGQNERAHRRQRRRLEYNRAAGRQRRCNLPGRRSEREVPRRDRSHHTDGLLDDQVARLDRHKLRILGLGHKAFDQVSVVGQRLHRGRDVGHVGLAEGAAAVLHLVEGKLVLTVDQHLGHLPQDRCTLRGRLVAPDTRIKRPPRCSNRCIHVGRSARRNHRPGLFVGRVDALVGFASCCGAPRPVDEEFKRLHGHSARQKGISRQPAGRSPSSSSPSGCCPRSSSCPSCRPSGR